MTPKILHQMWIGPPMPEWISPLTQTWRTHHPDWEHRFWINPPKLRNHRLWDNAETISSNPWQYRADVARYEILYQFGGVWVDADMECLKPIDDLVTDAFMGWEVQDEWVNNALIGASAGHPFLEAAIAALPMASQRHGANTIKSGPQFITPIAVHHGVTIYDQAVFYPYLWNQLDRSSEDFPDSWAVHHWNNRRRLQDRPL